MTVRDLEGHIHRHSHIASLLNVIFIARRYSTAVHAVVVCPSICPSLRLSHSGIVPKRLNLGSRKQRCTIGQGF